MKKGRSPGVFKHHRSRPWWLHKWAGFNSPLLLLIQLGNPQQLEGQQEKQQAKEAQGQTTIDQAFKKAKK